MRAAWETEKTIRKTVCVHGKWNPGLSVLLCKTAYNAAAAAYEHLLDIEHNVVYQDGEIPKQNCRSEVNFPKFGQYDSLFYYSNINMLQFKHWSMKKIWYTEYNIFCSIPDLKGIVSSKVTENI